MAHKIPYYEVHQIFEYGKMFGYIKLRNILVPTLPLKIAELSLNMDNFGVISMR